MYVNSERARRNCSSRPKDIRASCDCQASEHPLVNNCVNCGRIVCKTQGLGPCFTCGNIVSGKVISLELQCILKSLECASAELEKNICEQRLKLLNAVRKKDKLLEWNSCSLRTRVIDDDENLFPDKRDEDDESSSSLNSNCEKTLQKEVLNIRNEPKSKNPGQTTKERNVSRIDRVKSPKPPPQGTIISCLCHSVVIGNSDISEKTIDITKKRLRIQDKDLQVMSDSGMCLSIQQPYATLIIKGLKKHDGRNWYTSHRGRLWIHAGARRPTEEEHRDAHRLYRVGQKTKNSQADEYPTGCLLGWVELSECMAQKEYRMAYPEGEIGTEYVLVFENPRELENNIMMKGSKGGIFKMATKVCRKARKLVDPGSGQ